GEGESIPVSEATPTPPVILIIAAFEPEDSPLAKGLRSAGYDLAFASEVATALDMILSLEPACVVCDYDLVDEAGDTVARKLRELQGPVASTPFVLLTSPTAARVSVARFSAGVDVCIAKPFAASDVVAQVKALLQMTLRLRDSRAAPSRFPRTT